MWELLALLIIGGVIMQGVIDFIRPLIPYMTMAAVLLLIGGGLYYKNRSW